MYFYSSAMEDGILHSIQKVSVKYKHAVADSSHKIILNSTNHTHWNVYLASFFIISHTGFVCSLYVFFSAL